MSGRGQKEKLLLDVIADLYGATTEPKHWRSLKNKLPRLFNSESCLLHIIDLGAGKTQFLSVTDNFSAPVWDAYKSHYYREDQWAMGAVARMGQAVIGRELAPPEWYRKSAILNEFSVSSDTSDVVGTAFTLDGGRIASLGVHRPRGRPLFDETDRAKFAMLLPHLKRAVRLTDLLSTVDLRLAFERLEHTNTAFIAVDRQGSLLSADKLAIDFLRGNAGLRLLNGRITGIDPTVTARLSFLIQTAADAASGNARAMPGGAIGIERGEGRLPLTLLVTPFRRPLDGSAPPGALILIRDAETPSLATSVLRDLFGLTPAQASVASSLADGRSLDDIAATLRISPHTARDHLKQIFVKTRTTRQPQLVALLLRTVASLN